MSKEMPKSRKLSAIRLVVVVEQVAVVGRHQRFQFFGCKQRLGETNVVRSLHYFPI